MGLLGCRPLALRGFLTHRPADKKLSGPRRTRGRQWSASIYGRVPQANDACPTTPRAPQRQRCHAKQRLGGVGLRA